MTTIKPNYNKRPIAPTISLVLREAMALKEMSVPELAALVGMKPGKMENVVRGRDFISLLALSDIEERLGLPTDKLVEAWKKDKEAFYLDRIAAYTRGLEGLRREYKGDVR